MIIVTGATGKLGGFIVEQLLKKLPPAQIAVSVQDQTKAEALASRGIRVREGDYNDIESLKHSFEGASKVLIISAPVIGEAGHRLHQNAIDAAKLVGAKRILYTSHMGASPNSLFPPMPGHAVSEKKLEASGLKFTALRHGFYAQSAFMLMAEALKTGKLILPEDGPVCWTTHEDLSEADAMALSQEGVFDGITPPLTSSETLDFRQLAEMASEITGREIQRITVSDQAYRDRLAEKKAPPIQIEILSGMFAASRKGEFNKTDPTLEGLLKRKPVSMREYLKKVLSLQSEDFSRGS